MSLRAYGRLLVPIAVTSLVVACGSSNNPNAPSGLSDADTTVVISAMSSVMVTALDEAIIDAASISFQGPRPTGLRSTLADSAAVTPIAFTNPCPTSGTVSVNGTVTNTINPDTGGGPGIFTSQMSFASCQADLVVLKGNPNVSAGGQFNFVGFHLSNPVIIQIGNALLFTLRGTDGSAAFNCSLSFDTTTFTTVATGNMTMDYPLGKNTSTIPCTMMFHQVSSRATR